MKNNIIKSNLYKNIVEISPNFTVIYKDDKILYANPTFYTILGINKNAEIIGRNIYEFLPVEMHEKIKTKIKDALDGKLLVNYDLKLKKINGETCHVTTRTLQFDYLGQNAILTTGEDITMQRITEEQLSETFKQLEDLSFALDTSSLVITSDAKGIVINANENYLNLVQYSKDELIGKHFSIVSSEFHLDETQKNIWKTIHSGNVWKGEINIKAKDGTLLWISSTIVPFLNNEGKPYRFVSIEHDITAKKKAIEKIEHLAYHDDLTNLFNRRGFDERMTSSILNAQNNNHKLAVFFLDLDNFKKINDSMGHEIGDILIKDVANRLSNCCEKNDILSRRSGDEFTILIPYVKDENMLADYAETLIKQFQSPFYLNGEEIYMSTSIGISIFPTNGENENIIMQKADIAMFRSKNSGKNTYSFYKEAMNEDALRRLLLEPNYTKN